MKKLHLNIEELKIETFDPKPADADGRGTVMGHISERAGEDTCGATCEGCVYPSQSCPETQTYQGYTCYCLYPNTDHLVCCSNEGCSGGGIC